MKYKSTNIRTELCIRMYCFHSLEIASITKIFTVKKKMRKNSNFNSDIRLQYINIKQL